MILIELDNKNYLINDDYELSPSNEILKKSLENTLNAYSSPADGFKTSFVAEALKSQGFNVLDVYDKEMEDSPEGLVY